MKKSKKNLPEKNRISIVTFFFGAGFLFIFKFLFRSWKTELIIGDSPLFGNYTVLAIGVFLLLVGALIHLAKVQINATIEANNDDYIDNYATSQKAKKKIPTKKQMPPDQSQIDEPTQETKRTNFGLILVLTIATIVLLAAFSASDPSGNHEFINSKTSLLSDR